MRTDIRGWQALAFGAVLLLVPAAARAQALPAAPVQEEEEPPQQTVPLEPAPDSLLGRRLQSVFSSIDDFEDVQVQVENGVVRLSGTVLRAQARERAAELAQRFEGVLYVDNEIEAETDVETRISPAVERIQEYLNQAVQLLPVLAVALIVVLLFWFLSMLLRGWEGPSRRFGISPLVWGLVRRLLRAVIVVVGLLLAFDILGVSTLVGAVLGTAGVLGIALGFAFQDIIENYLAGALLSIRQPFQVNDLIHIGETEGRVVRLTSRELFLLTLDGNHVQIPNATVFKSVLTNYSRDPRRLFHFDAGVDVNEDLTRAMEIGIQTLAAMRGVLADPPPFARVQELAASSVTVRYHGWVDQREADYYKVKSEAIRLVKEALDEAGVSLPEPIYQVRLRTLDGEGGPPPAEPARKQPAIRQAAEIDVAPDGKMEARVREDLASSGEDNLLAG